MSINRGTNIQSSQIQISFRQKVGEKKLDIGGRGTTDIGLQGDHASAYHLITCVVQFLLARNELSKATVLIFHIFDRLQAKIASDIRIIEEKAEAAEATGRRSAEEKATDSLLEKKLDKLNEEFDKILEDAKQKAKKQRHDSEERIWREKMYTSLFSLAEQDPKFKNTFFKDTHKTLSSELAFTLKAIANMAEHQIEEDIIDLTKSYLTIRNKLPLTSFPTEGNVPPPTGEGARVKAAAKQLCALVETYLENPDKKKDKNFAKDIAQQIYLLFWYPKIPNKILIDLNTKKGIKKWNAIKDNYSKGTKPRDNNLETLYEVATSHIELVLTCYPELTVDRDFANHIINEFVELVASKGIIKGKSENWAMNKTGRETFQNTVREKLVQEHGREELASSASQSASSTGSATRTPDEKKTINNILFTPTTSTTANIKQKLDINATPIPSLLQLTHPSAETPLTRASDTSYRVDSSSQSNTSDEEESREDSKNINRLK